MQVRKANRIGDLHEAKKYSEYTLCFSIGGIVFHIILALMVITLFLMLHYIAGAFDSLYSNWRYHESSYYNYEHYFCQIIIMIAANNCCPSVL